MTDAVLPSPPPSIIFGSRSESDDILGQNFWRLDHNIQDLMKMHLRSLPLKVQQEYLHWLDGLGQVMGDEIARNADLIDKNPPKLVKWDRRGREINFVEHSPWGMDSRRRLWKEKGCFGGPLDQAMPIVALYAARHLLAQSDTGLLCGTAMTSMVSLLIRRWGNQDIQQRFLPLLEHPDYDKGWRGSIWFTENESGGSDLGNLLTKARFDGTHWRLTGVKWFCSVSDADLVMTIARIENNPGTKGLCLFLLPKWLDDERKVPNTFSTRRLKEKLGCKSVPSGETDLKDAIAYPLCGLDGYPTDGKGLARAMLIISPAQRAGVAMMGEGISRRVFASSLEFAKKRKIFGKYLSELPNMKENLLSMMSESEAGSALLFRVGSLLKTEDVADPSIEDSELLQRIIVPMSKFRCCRRGVDQASKAIEIFGGNGFIHDWSMERQYRDAQNHPMWEGTEIILSFDVLRAAPTCLSALLKLLGNISNKLKASTYKSHARLAEILDEEMRFFSALTKEQLSAMNSSAHHFANLLADLVQYALLCEQALYSSAQNGQFRSFIVAAIFARDHLLSRTTHLWAHAVSGGYPKLRSFFAKLVNGEIISGQESDAIVCELVVSQAKL